MVLLFMGFRFKGCCFVCIIGKFGVILNKCEGDGVMLVGEYEICGMFY